MSAEDELDPPDLTSARRSGRRDILVSFSALVLWKTLEFWQRRAEVGSSPRTVLEEIKRIHCHPLPRRVRGRRPPVAHTHGQIKLRHVTQPDEPQAMLLRGLGITAEACASTRWIYRSAQPPDHPLRQI